MGIISGFIGALASAPVMAAAVTTKGLGDAVQHGAKDMPLLHTAGAIVSDVGEYGIAAAGSISAGISNMGDLLPAGTMASLGRGLGMGFTSLTPGSRENSTALARAPEVEAPAATPARTMPVGIEHISLASLGEFAPTTINVSGPVQSQGAVVGA